MLAGGELRGCWYGSARGGQNQPFHGPGSFANEPLMVLAALILIDDRFAKTHHVSHLTADSVGKMERWYRLCGRSFLAVGGLAFRRRGVAVKFNRELLRSVI